MSRKLPNFNIENKLKPNQKLCCSGCQIIFESVIAAAHHTVYCEAARMEKRKRKKEDTSDPQIKLKVQKSAVACAPIPNRVCTVTLHWSRRNTAFLLKSLYKRAHLFTDKESEDSCLWQDIVAEVKPQVPWMFGPICKTRWKKIRQETEKYLASLDSDGNSKESKPDFYFTIREIIRKMVSPQEEVICKREEGETTNEEELADPDAEEDEPFAGVMDSQGNMHLRDLLIEIVQSVEATPDLSDSDLAEKHGVEEAIVEWVKENQEAVLKGSLQCSSCSRRILKRTDYILHELDCIIENEKNKAEKGKGGLIISYPNNANTDQEVWSYENVASLIKVFRARAPSFMNSEGNLRKGIWLEAFKELKPKIPEMTPQMCCNKWTQLVAEARTHFNSQKNNINGSEEEKMPPPFYDKIAAIVELDNPYSLVPKDTLDRGEDGLARVFLKSSLEGEDEDGDPEEVDVINEDAADEGDFDYMNDSEEGMGDDSYEETLSNVDSSEDEGKRRSSKDRSNGKKWSSVRRKNGWSGGARMGEMERKIEAMTVRFKQLEEENRALRDRNNFDGNRDNVTTLVNRLERFLHNQNRFQTQQTEALEKMCSMWERHHRENINAMKTLVQELSRRKEKKTK